MISKRYAKANNPKCSKYDPMKPTTYLIDLDMNNLYGGAMILAMPTHGFKFLTLLLFRKFWHVGTLTDTVNFPD